MLKERLRHVRIAAAIVPVVTAFPALLLGGVLPTRRERAYAQKHDGPRESVESVSSPAGHNGAQAESGQVPGAEAKATAPKVVGAMRHAGDDCYRVNGNHLRSVMHRLKLTLNGTDHGDNREQGRRFRFDLEASPVRSQDLPACVSTWSRRFVGDSTARAGCRLLWQRLAGGAGRVSTFV
jgi:hypothetical protein